MTNYKKLYESLVDEIKYEKEQAELFYQNMKEENLTISTVEAEGFLRGMITVMNLVEHVENYTTED